MRVSFPLSSYLGKMGIAFLVSGALSVGVLSYAYDTKLRPSKQETFSLFVASSFQEGKEGEAYSALKGALSPKILQFDLYVYAPSEQNFAESYRYRVPSSDVIILPESELGDDLSLFADLPSSFTGRSLYEGKGVLVHEKGKESYPGDAYFSYGEESYYAFANVNGLHISSINPKRGDDETIHFLQFLGGIPS